MPKAARKTRAAAPAPLPAALPRATKRTAGATPLYQTPLALRSTGVTIDEELALHVRTRLARRLERFAGRIERISVRFEDVNGPRGGVDVVCRVKVVLAGLPSVLLEERGKSARDAFNSLSSSITRAVGRPLERAGVGARPMRNKPAPAKPRELEPAETLIGRRVGRGPGNLERVLERAEKPDTSAPKTSATARKAGGGSTARRNVKREATRATATLEDSLQARPSRKSTRRSANRSRAATKLEMKALRQATSSTAATKRAQASRTARRSSN